MHPYHLEHIIPDIVICSDTLSYNSKQFILLLKEGDVGNLLIAVYRSCRENNLASSFQLNWCVVQP